jgi:hypothetical protein
MQSSRFHSQGLPSNSYGSLLSLTQMPAIQSLTHSCSLKAHSNEACSQSLASKQDTWILLMNPDLQMFNDYHDTDFKKTYEKVLDYSL